jgi:hypothetical protein
MGVATPYVSNVRKTHDLRCFDLWHQPHYPSTPKPFTTHRLRRCLWHLGGGERGCGHGNWRWHNRTSSVDPTPSRLITVALRVWEAIFHIVLVLYLGCCCRRSCRRCRGSSCNNSCSCSCRSMDLPLTLVLVSSHVVAMGIRTPGRGPLARGHVGDLMGCSHV